MTAAIAVTALFIAGAALSLRHNAYINMLERAHRRKLQDQVRKTDHGSVRSRRSGD